MSPKSAHQLDPENSDTSSEGKQLNTNKLMKAICSQNFKLSKVSLRAEKLNKAIQSQVEK